MPIPRVLGVAQAFKETFSAREVAEVLARAARAAGAEAQVLVASDGGDGFLESVGASRWDHVTVTGPLDARITAPIAWLDDRTAVVESRLVFGLSLIPQELRSPLRGTTRGLGELIDAATAKGASLIYVGLGGSGTMDGGVGMARVWGFEPRDASGRPLAEGGLALLDLATVDRGRELPVELVGLADVENRLFGPGGARVFAAQKGATAAEEELLDRGLERLARVVNRLDLADRPGAGAAGGVGFGLMCFGGGVVRPGAPWVLERLGFPAALARASLVVAGEGSYDATSSRGKLVGEVMRGARRAGLPVLLLAPRAVDPPVDVVVETGGGHWDAGELERRAERGIRRALSLPDG